MPDPTPEVILANSWEQVRPLDEGLKAILEENIAPAFEVEYHPKPPAPKEVWEQRYRQVCGVFGVEMKREVEMPADLDTELTAHYADSVTGVPIPGPRFPKDRWPKDGYWVVRAPGHVYCFGNGAIGFTVDERGIRFSGYYERFGPEGLFDSLYGDFTQHNRENIEKLAEKHSLTPEDIKERYQKDRQAYEDSLK